MHPKAKYPHYSQATAQATLMFGLDDCKSFLHFLRSPTVPHSHQRDPREIESDRVLQTFPGLSTEPSSPGWGVGVSLRGPLTVSAAV